MKQLQHLPLSGNVEETKHTAKQNNEVAYHQNAPSKYINQLQGLLDYTVIKTQKTPRVSQNTDHTCKNKLQFFENNQQ